MGRSVNRSVIRWTLVTVLLCTLLPLFVMAAHSLTAGERLARGAQADAAKQNWQAAFQGYQAALALNPWRPGLRRVLAKTSRRWAQEYDGTAEPAVERALIEALVGTTGDGSLPLVLDRSMAAVPAGAFWLGEMQGRDDEQPARRVTLRAYQIDRYEVTHAQYGMFVEATGTNPPRYWIDGEYSTGTAAQPVVGVSWQQAQAFCRWAGKRLPTEAEWEKACRGEDGLTYPWGEVWDPERANVGLQSGDAWPTRLDDVWTWLEAGGAPDSPQLLPVGSLPGGVSTYGVMDLAGNASEWVQDAYNWSGYAQSPSHDPLVSEPSWNHVVRGSAWIDLAGQQAQVAFLSRCAARSSSHSADDPRVGFRCARDSPGEPAAE